MSETQAHTLNSKQMSYWHKLLHYRPNLLGKMVSEVDSKEFFVSLNGKRSPQEELDGLVDILNTEHAQVYFLYAISG